MLLRTLNIYKTHCSFHNEPSLIFAIAKLTKTKLAACIPPLMDTFQDVVNSIQQRIDAFNRQLKHIYQSLYQLNDDDNPIIQNILRLNQDYLQEQAQCTHIQLAVTGKIIHIL